MHYLDGNKYNKNTKALSVFLLVTTPNFERTNEYFLALGQVTMGRETLT